MKFTNLLRSAGTALLGLTLATLVHAQEYPSRSVKIIMPYAAGGQGDSVIRIIANALSQQLGQNFVVENIPGASAITGVLALMRSPPDGYTLMYNDTGQWAINPALYKKLPYDTLRDLAPVGLIATSTLFLVTTASFPANNVQELIAAVKAKPDFYTYASSGVGSPHHLNMEEFKSAFDLKIRHIPYKGSSQSVPAMVSGDVSMGIASLPAVQGFVKDGRLKLMAANSKNRSVFAPNVPAMREAGIPDYDQSAGIGIFAPAGTPKPIIDKLSAALSRTVASPDTVSRFAAQSVEPITNTTPEFLAQTVLADKVKFARIVKISGATAD